MEPHLAYMSNNAVATKGSFRKQCLCINAWICWPSERSAACAHAGKIAEKVKWFGYMPEVLMRLKNVKAWKGLLERESWFMSVVHVTTLVEG